MRIVIQLQKSCSIHGKTLDLHIDDTYSTYKETIYSYRSFRKVAGTIRTTFQDNRIEELALAEKLRHRLLGNKLKIMKHCVRRAGALSIYTLYKSR